MRFERCGGSPRCATCSSALPCSKPHCGSPRLAARISHARARSESEHDWRAAGIRVGCAGRGRRVARWKDGRPAGRAPVGVATEGAGDRVLLAAAVWALALTATMTVDGARSARARRRFISFHFGPAFAMVQSLAAPHTRAVTASLLLFVANLVGVGIGPYAVGALSDAMARTYGADSLRLGLLIVPPLFLWAAVHF